MQITMTMNNTVSSVLCKNGTCLPVFMATPAADVIHGYLWGKPIPAHENGYMAK